jgi:NADH dehydrogenase
MADLLLVGGTGLLGGKIAERLAARDVPFRVLVRPRTDATRLAALGAEVVRGDLTDRPSLPAALAGTTTVITTANAITRILGGATDMTIDAIDRQGNESLIRAAEAAGVQRLVFVAGYHRVPGMVERAPFAAAKVHAEDLLRASPMRSVIVRPGPFQDFWLSPASGIRPNRRVAVIHGHGRTPWAYVAADDTAEACVRLALADDPPAEFDFGGPQRLTRHEVVDAFERAMGGVKFRRVSVPRPVMAAGNRLLRRRNPALSSVLGMSLMSDMVELPLTDRPLRELGIEPRKTTDAIEQLVHGSA